MFSHFLFRFFFFANFLFCSQVTALLPLPTDTATLSLEGPLPIATTVMTHGENDVLTLPPPCHVMHSVAALSQLCTLSPPPRSYAHHIAVHSIAAPSQLCILRHCALCHCPLMAMCTALPYPLWLHASHHCAPCAPAHMLSFFFFSTNFLFCSPAAMPQ